MANTTVATITAEAKRRFDYDVQDTDLDVLLLDIINEGSIIVRQALIDAGLRAETGKTGSFVVLSGAESADMKESKIFGDSITFTGVGGDKLKVTLDGTDFDDIDISGDTTIQEVADAINTATAGSEATLDDDGNLLITSTTTDGTGSVTVADGSSTGTTVIARLFSSARERTDTGISDFGEPLRFREKDNKTIIAIRNWEDLVELQPDETQSTSSTPFFVAQWDGDSKVFFRSALSKSLRVYIDYFADQTLLTSGSTLPFKRKYDPVLKQYMRVEFFAWKFADDPNNPALLREEAKLTQLSDTLIRMASKFGNNRQTQSRREGVSFGPRVSSTSGSADTSQ